MGVEFTVLGAGPTGLSCALILAKAGRRVVVVDVGRSLVRRAWIRNYLGLEDGLAGYELVERGKAQVSMWGGTFVTGQNVGVCEEDSRFVLLVNQQEVKSRQLVIATGLSTDVVKALDLPLLRGRYAQRIVQTDGEGRTPKPGVWAAGVIAGTPMQAIVGAGDGARVAINMLSQMRGSPYMDHDVIPASHNLNKRTSN